MNKNEKLLHTDVYYVEAIDEKDYEFSFLLFLFYTHVIFSTSNYNRMK